MDKNLLSVCKDIIIPGDIFLTTLPGSGLSDMIIAVQQKQSADKDAKYSHAAHFESCDTLLDTRWHVKNSNLLEYKDRPCCVFRPVGFDLSEALDIMHKDLGKKYPWARLFLHLLKLADNVHWDNLVCSERVAKYCHMFARQKLIFDFEKYYGWTPDALHDYMKCHDNFELIFKGVC